MRANKFQDILLEEFRKRAAQRASYKMSTFARDLGLSQARLTEILNGKQGLSRVTAAKICAKLNFSREESEYFELLVTAQHARSRKERELARSHLSRLGQDGKTTFFEAAQIPWMRWYHLALLCLFETQAEITSAQAATRLRLKREEAEKALGELTAQGLLKHEKSTWIVPHTRTETLHFGTVTPESIRQLNADMMEKAQQAFAHPLEERLIGASIMALSKQDLADLRVMIRDFRRRLEDRAGSADRKDAVYNFSFQFFELSR